MIVHRVGKGGRYFWKRIRERNIYTLRQKIYREALFSFELAKELMEELERRTRELIDEVVGMIVASRFAVKTKPDAYAASCVADKHA